jgi:hypothetical protein
MLDETFSKLEIDEVECRKRAACEVYLKITSSSKDKVQRMALRMTNILK